MPNKEVGHHVDFSQPADFVASHFHCSVAASLPVLITDTANRHRDIGKSRCRQLSICQR